MLTISLAYNSLKGKPAYKVISKGMDTDSSLGQGWVSKKHRSTEIIFLPFSFNGMKMNLVCVLRHIPQGDPVVWSCPGIRLMLAISRLQRYTPTLLSFHPQEWRSKSHDPERGHQGHIHWAQNRR